MDHAPKPSVLAKYRFLLRRDPKTRRLTVFVCLLLAAAVAAGALLITAALDPYDNRILSGVTLGGVDVGGMTRREAREALSASFQTTLATQNMVVQLPEDTLRLSPEVTGIRLNLRAAVNDAFRHGRNGTEAAPCQMSLLPYLTVKEEAITAALQAYADAHNVAYTDPGYQLVGQAPELSEDRFNPEAPCQTLQLLLGTPLTELDIPATLNQILESYGRQELLLEIPEIPPTQAPPDPDLETIYQAVSIAPVDTSVSLETFSLVPGSYGYDFDLEQARLTLAQAAPGETLSIPMRYIEPEVLGQEAFFLDVLGSCETPHTADENRNTNLQVACASLDGLILQPGEEFSYNTTLGERTKDRGYKPAPAYSGTELVPSYGGGICQVSSTLYYCTLLADVEILERVNHGYVAKYIQIGTDATVSWWGPDFRFRNNTNFPMMIQAEVSDGYVKIQLLGTDEKDYYVEMESETRGYASTGYYVKTYKLKYDKETGELLSREFEAASSYRPSYY